MGSGSDVVRVVAFEGDWVCVPRCGPVRGKRAREVDLHMLIEALFIRANIVAAVKKAN